MIAAAALMAAPRPTGSDILQAIRRYQDDQAATMMADAARQHPDEILLLRPVRPVAVRHLVCRHQPEPGSAVSCRMIVRYADHVADSSARLSLADGQWTIADLQAATAGR